MDTRAYPGALFAEQVQWCRSPERPETVPVGDWLVSRSPASLQGEPMLRNAGLRVCHLGSVPISIAILKRWFPAVLVHRCARRLAPEEWSLHSRECSGRLPES